MSKPHLCMGDHQCPTDDADLNIPCTHGNSPVTCVPCLNDACHEGAVLAELEEESE